MTVRAKTDRLTKHFGAVVAVDSVSFEINAGEIVGYLGPNGAGKTTTLRLLLDFVRPTSGTCELLGGSPRDPAVRDRIGYLPAELRLERSYTANDYIDFYGRLRSGGSSLAGELCERFGLDPSRRVGELSTGNRRKIAVVLAFMHRPELLLLDEPSSGLDPLLQDELHHLLRETAGAGAAVLLSSHALREVEALADRVGILRRGELVALARTEELRSRARQRIELHVAGPVDPDVFGGIPEVVATSVRDGVVVVDVEGSVDRVLKAAARLDVVRLYTHETDLEEVFLGYYREDDE